MLTRTVTDRDHIRDEIDRYLGWPGQAPSYKLGERVLGPESVERIRVWHYPGPETNSRDALEQAWLLCQLMAMEKADVVITIGGKPDKSASTILHLAQIRQKPVVPFTFLGGAAERVYLRRNWRSVYPWLDARKLTDKNAVVDAMAIANEMVTARVHDSNTKVGPLRTVFISRARADAEHARALENYLPKIGLTVLFGEKALPADRTIESAIEDAVLQSDLFIVLWSRAYAASRYCYDEIDLALQRYAVGELRLWIINLDGSDVVPPNARELPIVVARTPSRVLEVVRDLLAGTD